jgi:hypothetical protein
MANNNLVLKSDLETDTDTSFYAIPGMVTLFAGDVVPEGWLHCDGSQFLESDYPLLYEALGSLFLPNLQENYLISGVSNEVDYQIGSKTHTHSYKYAVPTGNNTNDGSTGSNHNQNFNYTAASAFDVNGGSIHTHTYGSDYYANSGVALSGRGNGNNQANLISNHRHRAATIYGANFNGTTGVAGLDYASWTYNFGDLHTHTHNLAMAGGGSNQTYAHTHSITGVSKAGTTTTYSNALGLAIKEYLPRTMYFKYIIKAG